MWSKWPAELSNPFHFLIDPTFNDPLNVSVWCVYADVCECSSHSINLHPGTWSQYLNFTAQTLATTRSCRITLYNISPFSFTFPYLYNCSRIKLSDPLKTPTSYLSFGSQLALIVVWWITRNLSSPKRQPDNSVGNAHDHQGQNIHQHCHNNMIPVNREREIKLSAFAATYKWASLAHCVIHTFSFMNVACLTIFSQMRPKICDSQNSDSIRG